MTVAQPSEIVPLHTDADGVVRVGGTRVTLETLVAAFDRGSTAEEICEDFPGLELGDVYAVLTYTLRHRSEVDRAAVLIFDPFPKSTRPCRTRCRVCWANP